MSRVLAIALVLSLSWLAWQVLPPGHAIRVRNAFLLRRGRDDDFTWTPTSLPAGYRVETTRPPLEIERALADTGVAAIHDDWSKALAIATMLVSHARREGAIRADLTTTFRGILEGRGYCADYVRVFLAAACHAGLFCRQWAFSFDGFGGHGHTFVELFDREREAWAFLDIHNNVYATLPASGAPLSALDLHRALIERPDELEFPRVGPGRLGFPHRHRLLDYYRRGVAEWYLVWGNDVISRETTRLTRPLPRRMATLLHRMRSATWRLPPIVVLATPENDMQVKRMERLRRQFVTAIVLVGVTSALLLAWRLPVLVSFSLHA
jgi:hypothetical protein